MLRLAPQIEITNSTNDPTAIQRKEIFIPCIRALSPQSAAELILTVVIIPTNTADPMDPAMVRKEVRNEDASATFWEFTLLVPHVSRRIIRLPMKILLITLSPTATQSGVAIVRKNIPILLSVKAADPTIKI